MIKQLLCASFLCAATLLSAQQLTNSGFENWTNGNPDNWGSSDALLAGLGLTGTTLETQVSPGNSGASACQLQTQNIMFVGDVPGLICSGPLTSNGTTIDVKGAPFTGMPSSYTFYFKNAPVNGDTAGTEAYFTKWNTTTNSRDTLGVGGMLYTSAVSSFSLGTVNIVWLQQAAPDTLTLVFFSSIGGNPQVNSTFTVDDVMMNYSTGVSEPFMGLFSVYPNPANDVLNISAKDANASKVEIYDLTGRNVKSEAFTNNQISVSTSSLAEGLYIYRIYDVNGIEIKSSKFTVAR